ncbi:uncharacterized protein EI90DRAFT_3022815 [Cantharellus anzutake]|uniref:uncharacterized protein n=1 Tax=Cantharellus anzutake TaxID=1750568 RepID=UPI0019051E46|nr:uncharacterized protein EI90DRAFT_3022815 [Cantharellus anzutake]KAF8313008.1 hypothetical protein EI90DRAFT_3022815 [Cantharellus anzutake]
MTPLPDNNDLRRRITGLYLGDDNIASQVGWIYAKARHCHVLCLRGANKADLNPTPVVLHGIFAFSRQPFKLLPDGGFRESNMPEYFNFGVSLQEAMARTNAWARLERIQDNELLGFSDFPQYIKNLKSFEGLMHVGDAPTYSLVSDEGASGPQVKVIHRMFESCWDTIRLATTPQQSDIEDKATYWAFMIAEAKTRYKLTPGDHPVAVRLANAKSPGNTSSVTVEPSVSRSLKPNAELPTEPSTPPTEPSMLPTEPSMPPTEPTTPRTEPKTPESRVKALPDLDGCSDNCDNESVDGFLGPEFGLEHWPVAPENFRIRDKMFKEQRWQTNPLHAYREGIQGVISPAEYLTALPGATVQASFTLACHLIGSKTGKRATYSARVEEIIVLKNPPPLLSDRAESGSPSKRQFSGPSFSPVKHQRQR